MTKFTPSKYPNHSSISRVLYLAFFFSCVGEEVSAEGWRSVTQLCLTLCDPIDYSPPGRQGYWSKLTFPPPGELPNPGIELWSPASPALAGRFFTTELYRAATGRDGGCQSHASSMRSELGAGMGIPSSSPPISSSKFIGGKGLTQCLGHRTCSTNRRHDCYYYVYHWVLHAFVVFFWL